MSADLEIEPKRGNRVRVTCKCMECNLFNKSMPRYKIYRCNHRRTCPGLIFDGIQKSKILKALRTKINARGKKCKD